MFLLCGCWTWERKWQSCFREDSGVAAVVGSVALGKFLCGQLGGHQSVSWEEGGRLRAPSWVQINSNFFPSTTSALCTRMRTPQ